MIGNLFNLQSLAGPAQDMSGAISSYLESLTSVVEQAGGENAPQDLKDAWKQVQQCDTNAKDCANSIANGTIDQSPVVLNEDPIDHEHSHDHFHPGPSEFQSTEEDPDQLSQSLSEGISVAGGGSPSVPEATASAAEARARASAYLAESRSAYQQSLTQKPNPQD